MDLAWVKAVRWAGSIRSIVHFSPSRPHGREAKSNFNVQLKRRCRSSECRNAAQMATDAAHLPCQARPKLTGASGSCARGDACETCKQGSACVPEVKPPTCSRQSRAAPCLGHVVPTWPSMPIPLPDPPSTFNPRHNQLASTPKPCAISKHTHALSPCASSSLHSPHPATLVHPPPSTTLAREIQASRFDTSIVGVAHLHPKKRSTGLTHMVQPQLQAPAPRQIS